MTNIPKFNFAYPRTEQGLQNLQSAWENYARIMAQVHAREAQEQAQKDAQGKGLLGTVAKVAGTVAGVATGNPWLAVAGNVGSGLATGNPNDFVSAGQTMIDQKLIPNPLEEKTKQAQDEAFKNAMDLGGVYLTNGDMMPSSVAAKYFDWYERCSDTQKKVLMATNEKILSNQKPPKEAKEKKPWQEQLPELSASVASSSHVFDAQKPNSYPYKTYDAKGNLLVKWVSPLTKDEKTKQALSVAEKEAKIMASCNPYWAVVDNQILADGTSNTPDKVTANLNYLFNNKLINPNQYLYLKKRYYQNLGIYTDYSMKELYQ